MQALDPKVAALLQRDMFSGCLVYQGRRTADGYPVAWVEGESRLVHRYVWEKAVGPIPPKHVLDHLLRDRTEAPGACVHGPGCCEPAHLEPVPVTVNAKRVRPWNRSKTHCPSGHRYDPLFDEDGVLLEEGHAAYYQCADGYQRRFCGTCRKRRGNLRRRAK